MEPHDLVLVGSLTAPHGIKGQMKLTSYTADTETIDDFPVLYSSDGTKQYYIRIRGVVKQQFLVDIQGCASRNDAERLRNTGLYAPRSAFPEVSDEDDFYITDLIGLEVRDASGEVTGIIADVHNFGAGDILDIRPPQGASFMVAFTKDNFPEINMQERYVRYQAPDILPPSQPDTK
jgi:16S rRNA processing protein RimM